MENDNENQLPEDEISNPEQFKVGRAPEDDLEDTELDTTDESDEVELGFTDDPEPEGATDAPLTDEDDEI